MTFLLNAAATAIQFPQNPLHFRSSPSRSAHSAGRSGNEEDSDDEDYFPGNFHPSQVTLHVMSQESGGRGRQSILTPAPRGSPAVKTKGFFDELVNIPPPEKRRSRIVYIRDFPTLAASASSWYPPLLSAVRQRRQGPLSRPSSPISNSMTIIFGMTPPMIQPSSSSAHGSGPQGLLGLMTSRQSPVTVLNLPAKPGKNDFGEDEHADKARERRLRDRLRRWERDEHSVHDELPRLPHPSSSSPGGSSDGPGIVIVGGPGGSNFPPILPPALASAMQNRMQGRFEDSADHSPFFRTSVLVPSIRSQADERRCRVSRRREINELTMRMGVGAIGGRLDGLSVTGLPGEPLKLEPPDSTAEAPNDWQALWEEWGKQVEAWTSVKDIADRAVGSIVAAHASDVLSPSKTALEPTQIPWSSVISAWASQRSSRDVRKAWIQESTVRPTKEQQDAEEHDADEHDAADEQDEVIQRVKEDPDLTQHEQRLLGCIVNACKYLFRGLR